MTGEEDGCMGLFPWKHEVPDMCDKVMCLGQSQMRFDQSTVKR